MTFRPSRIYVHPDFEKNLKRLAVEKNKSVVSLTREIATDDFTNMKLKFKTIKRDGQYDIFRQ